MKIEIENYENMTAEEKVAALEAYKPEEHGYVSKSVLDKAAADAAKYKRDLRAANEASEATKTTQKSLEERIAELETEKKVTGATAQFLALGYDTELAKRAGEALVSGDTDTVFEVQKTFLDSVKKEVQVEKLKSTPTPTVRGHANSAVDYDQLIEEAKQKGDFTALAYYTRLKGEAEKEN